MDDHGLADGRLCAGAHKPVNGARICPARVKQHALMRSKAAAPPASPPDARDTPFESERDRISQNIEVILEFYKRE